MLYFTNQQLEYTYGVSVKTVRNWVKSAQDGKLDLALYTQGRITYVANSAGNIALIEQLVAKGKKYRSHRTMKIVRPGPDFYKNYTQAQIYDIVTNLEIHHEIPRQYNYIDGGAHHWDEYAQRLANEEAPNLINSTFKLLAMNGSYIDSLLAQYEQVNVVDIGVGNALPVKDLLAHLLEQGKLGRYIAIDISREMLNIAQRNIKEWFDDRVAVEDYELDIDRERFDNILAEEYIKEDAKDTVNLILHLGGTLYNLRKPDGAFKVIHDSMGINDYLMQTTKLDSEATRKHFDFNVKPGEPLLAPIHGFIVDLLGIDPTFYSLELGYDAEHRERYERIRFKLAVTIEFEFNGGKRVISFDKGDAVLIWRGWQYGALDVADQFDRNSFYTLHASQTADREYLLTIAQVKRT